MRLLIDGYWWHEGPHSNRMVLREIVQHWTSVFPNDDLIVAAPKSRNENGSRPRGQVGIRVVNTHLHVHPAINAIELPIIARRESADTILAFNFATPSKRAVVFLHDVLFQTNPEWFTRIERAYFSAMPFLAKWARSAITSSVSEKQRITAQNPKIKRVVSCGLAIASSLANAEPQRPDLELSTDSFVVCVGRFNARKNLETTVRAMLKSGLISEDFPLVLVGEASGAPAHISQLLSGPANKSVLTTQRLTDGELRWLYENCRLFVCLSLDEGFGLPVIEAAAFGAPVLISDIPVFRENLGTYGTFVSPTDIDAIATAARHLGASRSSGTRYTENHTWESVCRSVRSELARP